MSGVFVRILPSCEPSDFSKTLIFEFSISASEHVFKPFGLNNMNKHTAG